MKRIFSLIEFIENLLLSRYCGSLFVGHCSSKQLVEHFQEFQSQMSWDSSYLLHFGMDGPNVNLKFQKDVQEMFLETLQKKLLDIDTCTLHKVHTSFRRGVLQLPIDIDDFAVNLHGFFKLSSARREDYRKMEDITDVVGEYVMRHSSTRWLTMKYVLVRIIDQWKNLKEYFLKYLPKQKEFKRSISETKRYKQIVELLKDDLAVLFMSFAAFLAHQYESYLLTFQSEEPRIHMLYNGMGSLLSSLMSKFVNKKSLYVAGGEKDTLKPVIQLLSLNVNLKENLKSKALIDIGTKAKLLLSEIPDQDKVAFFRSSCLKCYVSATDYLQINLPFNNKVIEHAQFLHPEKRNHAESKSAISNLALKVTGVFGKKSQSVFQTTESNPEIVDLIRDQWSQYQIDDIPPFTYLIGDEKSEKNKRKTNSYWEYALKSCGLYTGLEAPKSKYIRVDQYWNTIGEMTNESGALKYTQLFNLAKTILSLSHGNAVPERGFSINKYILAAHGNALKEDTIVALRLVKDELCSVGGMENFKVTKPLMRSVKGAYARYEAHLAAQRELEIKKKRMEQEREQKEKENTDRIQTLQKLDQDIVYTKDSIKQLESTLDEANKDIKEALREPVMIKDRIAKAHTLIDMALERKRKLETTLEDLVSKKNKL